MKEREREREGEERRRREKKRKEWGQREDATQDKEQVEYAQYLAFILVFEILHLDFERAHLHSNQRQFLLCCTQSKLCLFQLLFLLARKKECHNNHENTTKCM